MSHIVKEKSNSKGMAVFKAVILLALLCIFAWKVYEAVGLTKDTIEKRDQLIAQNVLTDEEKVLVDEWNNIMCDRLVNYGMTLIWYVIVFLCVVKVGPPQSVLRHISKAEAGKIAEELEKSYRSEGIFVEKGEDDEDDSEILPDSLDIPKLISAELKDNMIEVVWEGVPYADGYTVYRRTEESKWKRIGRTTMENTVYQDYALADNTRYIYSVKAFLVSEDKKIVSRKDTLGKDVVSGKGNLPDIPEIFPIEEDGRKGIGWKALKGVRGYRIFVTGNGKKWKQIAKIPASEECKYFVDDSMAGGTYKYAVSASVSINKHPVVGEHDKDGIAL